jgi:ribosome assembly protein YihI (activator of Der GTPase)
VQKIEINQRQRQQQRKTRKRKKARKRKKRKKKKGTPCAAKHAAKNETRDPAKGRAFRALAPQGGGHKPLPLVLYYSFNP